MTLAVSNEQRKIALIAEITKFYNAICSLDRGNEEGLSTYCQIFKGAISKKQYHPDEVKVAFKECIQDEAYYKSFILWLNSQRVFSYVIPNHSEMGMAVATEGSITSIPSPQTVLQPDKMPAGALVDPGHSKIGGNGLSEQEVQTREGIQILTDLATSEVSTYISSLSGTGKTNLMRAIALAAFNSDRETELMFIDLQSNTWLGFQVDRNKCVLATLGDDLHMLYITEAIKYVMGIFQKRTKEAQDASRTMRRIPEFHPFKLFFNEWNRFYTWTNRYKGARLTKWKALAKENGIEDPLEPRDATEVIGDLFGIGRDQRVTICASGQSYDRKDSGFSVSDLRNVNLVSTGLISPNGDGGYNSSYSLASNSNRISDARAREYLKRKHDWFVENNIPVIVTTQKHGCIGKLPNTLGLEHKSIAAQYKRGPITSDLKSF